MRACTCCSCGAYMRARSIHPSTLRAAVPCAPTPWLALVCINPGSIHPVVRCFLLLLCVHACLPAPVFMPSMSMEHACMEHACPIRPAPTCSGEVALRLGSTQYWSLHIVCVIALAVTAWHGTAGALLRLQTACSEGAHVAIASSATHAGPTCKRTRVLACMEEMVQHVLGTMALHTTGDGVTGGVPRPCCAVGF